jgi:pseudouridine-5'-phosphate glycosidase
MSIERTMSAGLLDVHAPVAHALAAGEPVVALESTLLAHGLPPSRRAEAAQALEDAVRAEGATPATIAILGGRLCVGLDEARLRRVIEGAPKKASIRDLAWALATGEDHATTVATTMAIAARAGVPVFATGGIGGVHREVVETFDESADLMALATYPVAVVSAGAKSVLDLPRTMERLETLGVPVIGYRTRELPAFYHAHSGIALAHGTDDLGVVADVVRLQLDVLRAGGVLVVQPPPVALAQDPARVDALIEAALSEARAAGVRGAAITPFLLSRLDHSSGGAVVDTNLALVLENARTAARLAVSLAARRGSTRTEPRLCGGPR